MLTARIAILLSAKLESEGRYTDDEESPDSDEQELDEDGVETENGGGVQLNAADKSSTVGATIDGVKDMLLAPIKVLAVTSSTVQTGNEPKQQEDDPLDFDRIPTEADTDGPVPPEDIPEEMPTKSAMTDKSSNDMMPSFSSDFWRSYGNHLRVFGTQESVCSLAG